MDIKVSQLDSLNINFVEPIVMKGLGPDGKSVPLRIEPFHPFHRFIKYLLVLKPSQNDPEMLEAIAEDVIKHLPEQIIWNNRNLSDFGFICDFIKVLVVNGNRTCFAYRHTDKLALGVKVYEAISSKSVFLDQEEFKACIPIITSDLKFLLLKSLAAQGFRHTLEGFDHGGVINLARGFLNDLSKQPPVDNEFRKAIQGHSVIREQGITEQRFDTMKILVAYHFRLALKEQPELNIDCAIKELKALKQVWQNYQFTDAQVEIDSVCNLIDNYSAFIGFSFDKEYLAALGRCNLPPFIEAYRKIAPSDRNQFREDRDLLIQKFKDDTGLEFTYSDVKASTDVYSPVISQPSDQTKTEASNAEQKSPESQEQNSPRKIG